MSRIGKNPVVIPAGVQAALAGEVLNVSGGKGKLSLPITSDVTATIADGAITIAPKDASKRARAMWGTTRALVNNMVTGVSAGFTRTLEINGVGYRAAVQGKVLNLQLGFSHDVPYAIPPGITIVTEKPTMILVSGIDKQLVGQVAAEIRSWRPPEPYKGKGVRYEGEYVRRKEGKKK